MGVEGGVSILHKIFKVFLRKALHFPSEKETVTNERKLIGAMGEVCSEAQRWKEQNVRGLERAMWIWCDRDKKAGGDEASETATYLITRS